MKEKKKKIFLIILQKELYVDFYKDLINSEYLPPYEPILFKNENSLISTLILNDKESDIELSLSTSFGKFADVSRKFIRKQNDKVISYYKILTNFKKDIHFILFDFNT